MTIKRLHIYIYDIHMSVLIVGGKGVIGEVMGYWNYSQNSKQTKIKLENKQWY